MSVAVAIATVTSSLKGTVIGVKETKVKERVAQKSHDLEEARVAQRTRINAIKVSAFKLAFNFIKLLLRK